jgi:hypothetical protein
MHGMNNLKNSDFVVFQAVGPFPYLRFVWRMNEMLTDSVIYKYPQPQFIKNMS